VTPGQWNNIDLVTYLSGDRPRMEITYNGTPTNAIFSNTEKLIISKLIEHLDAGPGNASNIGLDKAQLFLGGFPVGDPRGADIGLDIDSLVIEFPNQRGSSLELIDILNQFTRTVNGELTLDEASKKALLQTFFTSFGGAWASIETEALAFVAAFEGANAPLFPDREPINPSTVGPEALLTFYLQQWIFDNLFVDDSVSSIAGVKFEVTATFSGKVSETAPRVTGNVQVDGPYKTDPAILCNDQATVIRPPGFYAAPGELVSVQVPESAIAAGLKLRAGIQRADM